MGNPHQHGRVAVEVGRGEEHAAIVGQQQLLDADVGHAKHQHVVHAPPGVRVDRVGAATTVAAVELAVHQVPGPAVGLLPDGLRHRHRQLVEDGHRCDLHTLTTRYT